MKSRTSCQFFAKLAGRRAVRLLQAVLLSTVGFTSVSHAANYYWDPSKSNTDPGSGGTGTWDTTSTFWKLAGTSGDVAWPNTTANTADFAGTAGTVTLGSAITTGGLIFDTAGYDVETSTFALSLGTSGITANPASGTTTINGAITSLGSQSWKVASGGTLTVGAIYTSAASTNYNLDLSGAGTVNFAGGTSAASNVVTGVFSTSGGCTVNISGYFNTASSTAGSTKFDLNGGATVNWSGTGTHSGIYNGIGDGTNATLNVTAGSFNSSPTNTTFIGTAGTGLLNISGGLVTIGTSTAVYLGDGYNGGGGTGNGTITISGGQFTTGATTGSFVLGSTGTTNTGTGTINLNGGTFSSNRAITGAAGKASIVFNGGTLQATGTALSTAAGIAITVADNGGTLDSNGNTININSIIAHGGTAATDGGLTIASTNALTVLSPSANSTYNGPTQVNGGELEANGTVIPLSTGTITVANGANVTVANHAGGGSITMANNFTLNGAGKSITAPAGNATQAAGALAFFNSGGFTLSGNVNLASTSIILDNPQTQTGNITFSGTISGAGGLVLAGGNSATTAVNFSLSGANTYGTTTPATQFTNVNATMMVTLSTNNNVLPTNTVLTLGGTPTGQGGTYNGGVNVALNGINQTVAGLTTSGTGTYRIIGNSTTLSTFTVNNTANYTFSGIIGSTGANNNNVALAKSGSGTLALSGVNTYTGGTTVNAGALTLSNTAATALADAGTLTMFSGSTLNLNANAGTSEVIAALVLDGTSEPAGTYTAAQLAGLDSNIAFNSLNGETLTITPVPEPATWAAGALMVGAAGWRFRRRTIRRAA